MHLTMAVCHSVKMILLIFSLSVQSISSYRRVVNKNCEIRLSSVKVEISAMLLRAICNTNNSTTLVVDCGTNVRYDRMVGLCNSSDIDSGRVLMRQPLMSSTLTVQLVQSGLVLDTAKVALLSSEQLFEYIISVWGNRSTRFLLTIEKECKPMTNAHGLESSLKGSNNSKTGIYTQTQPFYQTSSKSQILDQNFRYGYSQQPRKERTNTPTFPEYQHQNRRKIFESGKTNKINSQIPSRNISMSQQVNKTSKSDKSIEKYRSHLLRPEIKFRSDFDFHDVSEKNYDFFTPTTESSELAKLRWMEEKRIMFEKKMEFLRNFNPETDNINMGSTEQFLTKNQHGATKTTAQNLSHVKDKLRSSDSSPESLNYVTVSSSFHKAKLQIIDRYKNIAENKSKSSENIQSSPKTASTKNAKFKKLNYRVLDGSISHGTQNIDTVFENEIRTTQKFENSPKFFITKDKTTTAPIVSIQAALYNKRQNIDVATTTTTKTVENKLSVSLGINYVISSQSNDVYTLHNVRRPSSALEQTSRISNKSNQNQESSSQYINITPSRQSTAKSDKDTASLFKADTTVPTVITTATASTTNLIQRDQISQSTAQTNIHNVNQVVKENFKMSIFESTNKNVSELSLLSKNQPSLLLKPTSYTYREESKENRGNDTTMQSGPMPSINITLEKNTNININTLGDPLATIFKELDSLAKGDDFRPLNPPVYPRSAPLTMNQSNDQEHGFLFDLNLTDKVNPGPLSSKIESKQEQYLSQNNVSDIIMTSRNNPDNETTLVVVGKSLTPKIKIIEDRAFEDSSASSQETPFTSNTSTPEKHEDNGTNSVPLEIDSTTLSNDETSKITLTDQPQTSEPSKSATNTSSPQANEDMEKDIFWPIVAALVIGVPALIVLTIAAAVICRKSKMDPAKMFNMKSLRDSRHASVLTLHADATERRRQVMGTFLRENMVTPRRRSEVVRTQEISRPSSIEV